MGRTKSHISLSSIVSRPKSSKTTPYLLIAFGCMIVKRISWTHFLKCSTSSSNNLQNSGCSISKIKIPGTGSEIMLLKLSSVLSWIALRNEETKKFVACMPYSSL
uniref:Uncharacterized protein n=1 Tax=Opuntia streptacantha TaxID=393608 RepID=A0A7C9CY44_OPUST